MSAAADADALLLQAIHDTDLARLVRLLNAGTQGSRQFDYRTLCTIAEWGEPAIGRLLIADAQSSGPTVLSSYAIKVFGYHVAEHDLVGLLPALYQARAVCWPSQPARDFIDLVLPGAVRYGSENVVAWLLGKTTGVRLTDAEALRLLPAAARANSRPLVMQMYRSTTDPESTRLRTEALSDAVAAGHGDTVDLLVTTMAVPLASVFLYALTRVVGTGDVDLCRRVFSAVPDHRIRVIRRELFTAALAATPLDTAGRRAAVAKYLVGGTAGADIGEHDGWWIRQLQPGPEAGPVADELGRRARKRARSPTKSPEPE